MAWKARLLVEIALSGLLANPAMGQVQMFASRLDLRTQRGYPGDEKDANLALSRK
jgi:hypothetical protein